VAVITMIVLGSAEAIVDTIGRILGWRPILIICSITG
jgi:hypothetical protein